MSLVRSEHVFISLRMMIANVAERHVDASLANL